MDDHDPDRDGNDLLGLKVAAGLYDLDRDAAEEYWLKLKRVLQDVFGRHDAQSMIEDYRERLRHGGPDTDFLAYHLDPLQVAADLAGEEILTTQHKIAYSRILEHFSVSPYDLPDENALNYGFPEDVAPRPVGY